MLFCSDEGRQVSPLTVDTEAVEGCVEFLNINPCRHFFGRTPLGENIPHSDRGASGKTQYGCDKKKTKRTGHETE